jgi:hypothetical protein
LRTRLLTPRQHVRQTCLAMSYHWAERQNIRCSRDMKKVPAVSDLRQLARTSTKTLPKFEVFEGNGLKTCKKLNHIQWGYEELAMRMRITPSRDAIPSTSDIGTNNRPVETCRLYLGSDCDVILCRLRLCGTDCCDIERQVLSDQQHRGPRRNTEIKRNSLMLNCFSLALPLTSMNRSVPTRLPGFLPLVRKIPCDDFQDIRQLLLDRLPRV